MAQKIDAEEAVARAGGAPWQAAIHGRTSNAPRVATWNSTCPYTFLEGATGFNSALFRYARTLVRAAAERTRPSEQRLREYAEPALPLMQQQLVAAVPVYAEREILTFSLGLERMREYLGPGPSRGESLAGRVFLPTSWPRRWFMQRRWAIPPCASGYGRRDRRQWMPPMTR